VNFVKELLPKTNYLLISLSVKIYQSTTAGHFESQCGRERPLSTRPPRPPPPQKKYNLRLIARCHQDDSRGLNPCWTNDASSTEAGVLNGGAALSRAPDQERSSHCLEDGPLERHSPTTVGTRTLRHHPIRRSQELRLPRTNIRAGTGQTMSPWCKMMLRRK